MYAKLSSPLRALVAIAFLAICQTMFAGTLPLITDDPETPGAGAWEINFALSGEHDRDGDRLDAPLFQVNHGFTDCDELRVEFAIASNDPDDDDQTSGISDLLLGYKYRFIDGGGCGWDVSVFPQITSPTGDEERDLGEGQTQLLIPLEFSKHFCNNTAWVNYEIGYNTVFGNRDDNWKFGVSTGREVSERLELLGEVGAFVFQDDEEHNNPFFNLGFKYRLNCNVKLMASAGRSFRSREDGTPDFFGLVGIQILFGRACEHYGCCCEEACGSEINDCDEHSEKKPETGGAYATDQTNQAEKTDQSDKEGSVKAQTVISDGNIFESLSIKDDSPTPDKD